MSWEIRKAKLQDIPEIVKLARSYDEFLMPYILNEFVVRNYIDQFMVAEKVVIPVEGLPHFELGGAVHYLPGTDLLAQAVSNEYTRVVSFLMHVKLVPNELINSFLLEKKSVAFLGHIICPGKGSFYDILEELKSQYEELWCWMSVIGPSYKSYERYGFKFEEERTFWNIYKCGYSTFTLGKWKKEG